MRPLNELLLKLSKRAEKYSEEHLAKSFVDVGPLFTLLSNNDNQIIFGRRGTGKTHVFAYLNNQLKNSGKVSVQIDMRTIGSTGGIYSDPSLTIPERATRLLSDTLCALHDSILETVIDGDENIFDLSKLSKSLDGFVEQATNVCVEGVIDKEVASENKSSHSKSLNVDAGVAATTPSMGIGYSNSGSQSSTSTQKTRVSGKERVRIHFGSIAKEAEKILKQLPNMELWILIDEWSEVPLDLQPYLADLLRRTLYPINGVTVKIAAIEQRCNFRKHLDTGEAYIGIEVGADASTSINLDEFMVFDNNEKQAIEFFGNLLYKHVDAIDEVGIVPNTRAKFINDVFTQRGAFEEFVRSSEGVPRDAINIISLAAQKAVTKQISIPTVRESARTWYHRSKHSAISSRPEAVNLLEWIINEVIGQRQTKGFLLRANIKDSLIEYLYDARVLHILKQGVSAQLLPGQRFNVYSLDYGCYVDLMSTNRAPKGLLIEEDEDDVASYISIPKTDFRSIRNSVLDLGEFYKSANTTSSTMRA